MFKITGLDNLRNRLNDLKRRAQDLNGTHSVPISELLTPEFLRQTSDFISFQAMCDASGFKIQSNDDFKAIPDDEWDAFISRTTSFRTWKEMLDAAGSQYVKRKLGF